MKIQRHGSRMAGVVVAGALSLALPALATAGDGGHGKHHAHAAKGTKHSTKPKSKNTSNRGPRGYTGAKGATGATGATGAAGAAGATGAPGAAGPGALKGSLFLEAKEEHDSVHPVLTSGPLQLGLSCDTTPTPNKDFAHLFRSAPTAGTAVSLFGQYTVFSSAFSNNEFESVEANEGNNSEYFVITAQAPGGTLEVINVEYGVQAKEETVSDPAGTRPVGCWAEVSAV
jgi:hypothetical protein